MHSTRTIERSPQQGLARRSKKRATEARARERVLAILDKATALVAMADHGGALFYVNSAGRAILGLARADDVSGISLIECVAPGLRTRIAEAAIPAALSKGVWSGDCILLACDGRQIVVSLMITAHRDDAGRLQGLSLLAQDLSAWTSTAAALRFTKNELLRLSAKHLAVQENERRRIAADLHDGLGQALGMVSVSLEHVADLLNQGESAQAAECVDRLKPKVRDTLDELRRIAMNLRPAMLDSIGVLATLSWHLREIETAYPGTRIERSFSVDETDVPNHLRTAIFRIVQEASSNAIRHGKADLITVRLRKNHGELELAVGDNGRGFDPRALSGKRVLNRGLGLHSMRERAELSCGICEIESVPGKGTRVRVRWPGLGLDRAAAHEAKVQGAPHPGAGEAEAERDLELLHNLSICVACIRSIKGDG